MVSAVIKIGGGVREYVFVLTDEHGASRREGGAPVLVDASGTAWEAHDCPWDMGEGLVARAIVHYGDVERRDDPQVDALIQRFMAVPMPARFHPPLKVWPGYIGDR